MPHILDTGLALIRLGVAASTAVLIVFHDASTDLVALVSLKSFRRIITTSVYFASIIFFLLTTEVSAQYTQAAGVMGTEDFM